MHTFTFLPYSCIIWLPKKLLPFFKVKAKAGFLRTFEKKIFYNFSICILKDAEWSKRYVFMNEKNFGSKGKILLKKCQYFMKISGKMSKFLTDKKKAQNIVAYFSISEHSVFFFSLFQKINLYWLQSGGLPPPPYTDWSVSYNFFDAFP